MELNNEMYQKSIMMARTLKENIGAWLSPYSGDFECLMALLCSSVAVK